jgi:hypothetical protein
MSAGHVCLTATDAAMVAPITMRSRNATVACDRRGGR